MKPIPQLAATFQQGSTKQLMARLADEQGAPTSEGALLTPDDFDSITFSVYASGEIVGSFDGLALVPAEVVSTELAGWGRDDTGRNFSHVVTADAFPAGGVMTSVIYRFTLTDGRTFALEFLGPTIGVPAE